MAERRRSPFTWVTWITPLMSGDASCWWSAWFKSHNTYDKLPDDNFNLDTWKVQHTEMVDRRAEQLRADGWTVTVEDQNKFLLRGRMGTLSGKPDLVAVKGELVMVEDCKSGTRRSSDRLQVVTYLFALPFLHTDWAGKRVSGRVVYRDGWVEVPAEQFTTELRNTVVSAMQRVSGSTPPPTAPSERECQFCDISKADCPVRVMDTKPAEATVSDF